MDFPTRRSREQITCGALGKKSGRYARLVSDVIDGLACVIRVETESLFKRYPGRRCFFSNLGKMGVEWLYVQYEWQGYVSVRRDKLMNTLPAQDWNLRMLEILEKTYTYDAKRMFLFTPEGERQNQLYVERLSGFRKTIDTDDEKK